MREILFRGKDTLGHWLYGGFHLWETRQPCVMDDKLKPEEIKHIIIQNSFADWNMPRTMQPYIVIPETIGQYTGLTDKNRTKIFEGDIAKVYLEVPYLPLQPKKISAVGVVEFNTEKSCYYVVSTSGKEYALCFIDEVIGNIHDNPELLKEREDNVTKS